MSDLSRWIGNKIAGRSTQPTGNAVKDVFNATADAALKSGVQSVRKTTAGQVAEQEATKQAVMDFVTSPLVLVGLFVGAVFFFARAK